VLVYLFHVFLYLIFRAATIILSALFIHYFCKKLPLLYHFYPFYESDFMPGFLPLSSVLFVQFFSSGDSLPIWTAFLLAIAHQVLLMELQDKLTLFSQFLVIYLVTLLVLKFL